LGISPSQLPYKPLPNRKKDSQPRLSLKMPGHLSIEDRSALFRRHGAPKVYYTHAYAAWEKGTVENANRLVRRWYPKGTDFSRVSPARIAALESAINSIHRKRLGGHTAQEAYHAAA